MSITNYELLMNYSDQHDHTRLYNKYVLEILSVSLSNMSLVSLLIQDTSCQNNFGSFLSLVMSKICESLSFLLEGSGVEGGALHPCDAAEVWDAAVSLVMSVTFVTTF